MQHFILDSQDGVIAMKRKYKRIGFTAAQKAELWDRWQKGEGLKSIRERPASVEDRAVPGQVSTITITVS